MGDLIKIEELLDLDPEDTDELADKGLEVLKRLSEEEAKAVMYLAQVAYLDRPGSCYFCNYQIDPNEEEFNEDSHLCLFCQLKVANILGALDIDYKKIFPEVGERKVQKSKI